MSCLVDGVTLLNSAQYHFALWDQDGLTVRNSTVLVDIEDQLAVLAYLGGAPPGASTLEILRASGRGGGRGGEDAEAAGHPSQA